MAKVQASHKKYRHHELFDDKRFIVKFLSLLVMIVTLSFLGIRNQDTMFSFKDIELPTLKWSTLKEIEADLSGSKVIAQASEDDFDRLSELDLSDISLKEQAPSQEVQRHHEIAVNRTPQKEKKVKKRIIITEGSSSRSAKTLKQRFYATHKSVYAIQIAKKFLVHKSYKRAMKWAMIANEIDNKNEESWILFAKAKLKMGQKRDAISALQAYLKLHKSSNVKRLLDDITKS